MPTKTRINSLKEDLEARYGPVMSASQVGQALAIKSRSTLDRWLRLEEQAGLKLLRFASRKGRFVLTRDLAAWLIRNRTPNPSK